MFLREMPANGLTALSEAPQPLTLCVVAAGVDLGLIPLESAGTVAQERVALVVLASDTNAETSSEHHAAVPGEIPAYLSGRFGADARLVTLVPDEMRQLSSGALVYRRSDPASPLEAIGVVLQPVGAAALALMENEAASSGLAVNVRDQGRAIPVRIGVEDSGD